MTADRAKNPYGMGRVTPQRRLIADVATAMPGAFTVEELAERTRATDSAAGVATVYRSVAAMLASGWLERVGERNGSALFARCHAGSHHHHHVVCDRCGRIEATDCPVVLERGASATGGFVITRHEVTLYGLCPSCARAQGSLD
jgi:Fur family transcriptional regulator, ferric uptake regulator